MSGMKISPRKLAIKFAATDDAAFITRQTLNINGGRTFI